jgi:hypothetical protein
MPDVVQLRLHVPSAELLKLIRWLSADPPALRVRRPDLSGYLFPRKTFDLQ